MDKKQWKRYRYLWLVLLTIFVLGGADIWRRFTVKADKPTYIFAAVDRGDVVSQVAAQGTLEPVVSVDVGSQVSGSIFELYADFNTEVKKGQLLAKLDPALFQADIDQQDATVRAAEATLNDDAASLATARADVEKAKVAVLEDQHKFDRQKELFDSSLISQDDFDTAQATLDADKAALKAAQAEIDSAEARIKEDQARLTQARASLETSKLNLEHSVITSPISGTVISRNVDRGQTVAASFSAPVLFTIGQDLTKMQVNTNIDEASVGGLHPGMQATFTVDAYPGQIFTGTIRQVRLSATTINNVVTYDALIDVPNPDLALKPGMTANVTIVTGTASGALKIPNSALRFKPDMTDGQYAAAFRKIGAEDYWNANKDDVKPTPPPVSQPGGPAAPQSRTQLKVAVSRNLPGSVVPLWVAGDKNELTPILVKLGLTDGASTQIADNSLREGDRIVVGLEFDPNRPARQLRPGFGGIPAIRR